MIDFIGSLFGFANDCLEADFPGLNISMAAFVYGTIAIFISLKILKSLLRRGDL